MNALPLTLSELCHWGTVVGKYATESSLGICSRLSFPICLRQTVINSGLCASEASFEASL